VLCPNFHDLFPIGCISTGQLLLQFLPASTRIDDWVASPVGWMPHSMDQLGLLLPPRQLSPVGRGFFGAWGDGVVRNWMQWNAGDGQIWGPEGHQIAASTARCIIYGAQCAPDSLIFLFFFSCFSCCWSFEFVCCLWHQLKGLRVCHFEEESLADYPYKFLFDFNQPWSCIRYHNFFMFQIMKSPLYCILLNCIVRKLIRFMVNIISYFRLALFKITISLLAIVFT